MKRKLLAFFLMTVLLVSVFLPVSASADIIYPETHIYDNLGVLTSAEKAALEAKADELSHEVPLYVVFAQNDNPYYMSAYGLDTSDSFVLLVVHGYGDYWYYNMHIYGQFYDYINDAEMNRVLDHDDVYDNLKNGNLYEGTVAWLIQTARVSGKNWGGILVRAFAFALVASGIAVLAVVLVYRKKQKSTNYPLSKFARLQLTDRQDAFITSTVTSYTVSSGSSSGRSGGGRSGGRHGGR